MADGKRVKLTLKRRKVQSNGGNSSGSSDRASAEKSPRLGDGNAAAATAVFGSASSLTASSHEDTDPRIDSVPSEALGDGQGCVGRDGESAGDLQAVFELLLPRCGSQVWTDMPELPPMCEEDDPSEHKSATEAMLLLNGGWPAKVTWSPLPPQS
ncbi:uncharacterized protein LOC144933166 [Lampetra fluviatilis]